MGASGFPTRFRKGRAWHSKEANTPKCWGGTATLWNMIDLINSAPKGRGFSSPHKKAPDPMTGGS
ncbi:hypothetical protein NBRC116594_38600 [Shimia sp. NS0008-38b]